MDASAERWSGSWRRKKSGQRDLPWVTEMREQPRGSSVTVHTGAAACRECQAPDKNLLILVFCPRNSKCSLVVLSPLRQLGVLVGEQKYPTLCVLFFHVEMDSVSLRDLKIAYGNVFLLSCSFCSALLLLDFTFSAERNSHYLFLKIMFCFSRASWTPCSPDPFKKKLFT